MIEWGPEIAVDGKPEWLADDDVYQVTFTNGAGGWAYPEIRRQVSVWPECIAPTHIRLPVNHWAYPVIENGFTPWNGGDEAPGDWDGGEVLFRDGGIDAFSQWYWGRGLRPCNGDIIGYRKKGETSDPRTPSPEWWIAQGRALQLEGKLPAGVVLPEPEFDYERYRAALDAFCSTLNWDKMSFPPSRADKENIRALIAAMPLMPKD